MQIYRKRLKTNKFKQNVERFLIWLFSLIGMLFVLGWSIDIFSEAGAFYLEPHTVKIVNQASYSDDRVNKESPNEPPAQVVSHNDTGGDAVSIIKRISREYDLDWKVLYGIYQKESGGDCSRIGDKHLPKPSIGCYQISLLYHPEITHEQAMDLEWSTKWTAERLKRYEKKGGSMDYAIRKHNGSSDNPATLAYLQDVKKIIESIDES